MGTVHRPIDMSDVHFEPATTADIRLIRQLARQIWLDHYPGIITRQQIDYMLERDYSHESLERGFSEGVNIILLKIGDHIRGFAAYGPSEETTRAKLHKLYLATSFHGHGYGSMLLQEVISRARSAGATVLELQVNKHNDKAILAYKRAGFIRERSILDAIGDGFFMDDYLMSRSIAPRVP